MTITQSLCESFIHELLQGQHDFTSDTFKIALIKGSHSGTYDRDIENYSELTTDEVSGGNYTAGGETMTATLTRDDAAGVAYVDFADVVWTNVTFDADGALIYNTSNGNAAVAVLDFVTTKSVSANDFTLTMPSADASNALIRFPLA